jgi:hypothetical protein
MTINLRIIRENLQKNGADAMLIPLTDRFLSRGQLLRTSDNLVAAITNMPQRLSYGTVIVMASKAAFFTSPLYAAMADTNVDKSKFKVFVDVDAHYLDFIGTNKILSYDPSLHSIKEVKLLHGKAQARSINLKPLSAILTKNTVPYTSELVAHAQKFSGLSSQHKFIYCVTQRL